ncbi:MAG: T9SS type A sorting domain-containing protein [Bacteroidales bacterium]|nr:T9SS type A sorting domain-containing protein [Bacteroidales bacterium]
MRNLIVIILTLFLISVSRITGLAQSVFHEQASENSNPHLSISREGFKTNLNLRNISGDTIWINDSIYKYYGLDDEWVIDGCIKVLTRDGNGNAKSEIELEYQAENNDWENRYLSSYSYYNDDSERIKEIFTNLWVSDNNEWIDYYHLKNNENGSIDEYYWKIWDFSTNNYLGGIKYTHSYNEFGISDYTTYSFNTTEEKWVYSYKTSYYYNANGQNIEILNQDWDADLQEWIDISHSLLTYEENGYLQQIVFQGWDNILNNWININKSLCSYDENGNIVESKSMEWYNGCNCWVEENLELYYYDLNNNVTEYIFKEWDSINNVWGNSSRLLYTYDEFGNNIYYASQNWYNNNWQSFDQWFYDYYNNELIKVLHQTWIYNTWYNYKQELYSFDNNENKIQYSDYIWHLDLNIWVKKNREDYFWSKFETSNISKHHQNVSVSVYPNPTDGFVNIIINEHITNPVNLFVIDSKGKIVKNQIITKQQSSIDLSELPKGIYFIHLDNPQLLKTIKVVVQ